MAVAPTTAYPQDVVRGTFFEHDVPVSSMFVHFRTEPQGYARPLRPHRVNRLISEFDRQALGVLLLSMRDNGMFAIIDGQHRVETAKRMGIPTMDALVYIDLTLEDEARLYRKFGDYLKQTALDKYHAGIAEHRPEYLAIQRVLQDIGLHVPQALGAGIRGIDAVDAIVRVATIYRPDGLSNALRLLHDAWDGQTRIYRSLTIFGTAMFLARFQDHPNFNRKRLIARMKRLGLSTVERQAYVIRDANLAPNPNSGWGQALMQVHDKGQPPGHELGEWQKRILTEETSNKFATHIRHINANTTPEQRSNNANKAAKTRFGNTPQDVICTYCRADVGTRCANARGEYTNNYHQARLNALRDLKARKAQKA
jgi:Family of unknown function (DUF6551)